VDGRQMICSLWVSTPSPVSAKKRDVGFNSHNEESLYLSTKTLQGGMRHKKYTHIARQLLSMMREEKSWIP